VIFCLFQNEIIKGTEQGSSGVLGGKFLMGVHNRAKEMVTREAFPEVVRVTLYPCSSRNASIENVHWTLNRNHKDNSAGKLVFRSSREKKSLLFFICGFCM